MHSSTLQQEVLDTVMDTSRHLVKALESADWLDRLLILAALLLFVLVVLFILKERIVDRGIRLVFWWTRFMPGLGPPGPPGAAMPSQTGIRGPTTGDL
jgi:protein transport protein SEC20